MVRMRVDIGIDPYSYACCLSFSDSQLINYFKFLNRLYIKTKNILIQCAINFLIRFTYSSKYHLAPIKAKFNCFIYFAKAYTVGTEACFLYFLQDSCIEISLHGIMHVKIIYFSSIRTITERF